MNNDVSLPRTGPEPGQVPRPLPAVPASEVSPGAAVLLSFLPGLGHVYLGLYERAVVLFVTFLAAVALAGHADSFGLVAAFAWFFGPIDAYRQARLINLTGRREEAPRTGTRGGSLGLGVFLTVVGVLLLLDRFFEIDLSWVVDWWPVLLVAVGLYLVGSAIVEMRRSRLPDEPEPWEPSGEE